MWPPCAAKRSRNCDDGRDEDEDKDINSGGGKLHLKWVRSAICAPVKQKRVVKGLGFTRLNQVIERPDNPAIRGMVAKVPHLVEIVQ